MAQAPVTVQCDLCSSTDARHYCINCCQTLCEKCKLLHAKGTKTKNDNIIPLSKADQERRNKTPVTLCDVHPTKEISLYCEGCSALLCTECLAKLHNTHRVITVNEFTTLKADQLKNILKILNDRKTYYRKLIDAESDIHRSHETAIEQCRKDLKIQKAKVIEDFAKEVDAVYSDHLAEILTLHQTEYERFSKTGRQIQNQDDDLNSITRSVETAIESKDPAHMIDASNNAAQLLQDIEEPHPSKVPTPKFQPDCVKYRIASLGRIYTDTTALLNYDNGKILMPRTINGNGPDTNTETEQKQNLGREQKVTFSKQLIDVRNVRITSSITVRDEYFRFGISNITVIIPLQNKALWVLFNGDKCLTLITKDGSKVRESAKVDSCIKDAKLYGMDLVVTCGSSVMKLTEDGQYVSTHAEFPSYQATGVCVTEDNDLIVCLKSTSNSRHGKVVKLGSTGSVKLTIQCNEAGSPIVTQPYRVTSLPSGGIVITDNDYMVFVDKQGGHVFTWRGETDGRPGGKFSPDCITYDKYENVIVTDCDNHKVYAISKDGSGAKCLLDGINWPWGIAVDVDEQLLISCWRAKIHFIEYLHTDDK